MANLIYNKNMKNYKESIKIRFKAIAEHYGFDTFGTVLGSGDEYYKKDWLQLDYNPLYGGYTILKIKKNTGASHFSKIERLPAKEFNIYLDGILFAINKQS